MTTPPGIRCSIAAALLQVGERWSLLILREAMMGAMRFDEFQSHLGIARNILAERLATLVGLGILTRDPCPANRRIHHYRLTEKGRDLLPVLAALMHWGDRWLHAEIGAPVVLVDQVTQLAVRRIDLTSADGRVLRPTEVAITAGPGATPPMRRRLPVPVAYRPQPAIDAADGMT
jgi:DNA-binding HxlR family transcriptional regulator